MVENEEVWRQIFADGNSRLDRGRAIFGMLPSDPRCMFCKGPFRGPGGRLMSVIGRGQSRQDPRFCASCVKQGDKHPGGAHVSLAVLFADMRGSTPTAERIGDAAFTELINRFFQASSKVLIDGGALLGRLAGDEAIGYFVPGFAGPEYVQAALDSARNLLTVTGHGDPGGPWIPLGVGVHTGTAFVGLLGDTHGSKELTALGDDINVGARLAELAGVGEILISRQTADAMGLDATSLEWRKLDLKGKAEPFDAAVVTLGADGT